MAKKSRMSLFVERFVSFNEARYADNPEALALFTGLTEQDLVFEDLVMGSGGARTTTVKSVPRNFVGLNQSWLAADINSINAYTMTSEDLLEDLDAVKAQTVPGIYAYLDGDAETKIAVVLPHDTLEIHLQPLSRAAWVAALKYDVLENEVTSGPDSVIVESPCFYGQVIAVIGAEEVFVVPPTDYGQLTFPEDAE